MAADGTLPPPPRYDGLRRPFRHLREQFKTLTGWGLHAARARPPSVIRNLTSPNADGISVSYLAAGPPHGRRIVFIHGSPGRADEWQSYLENCPEVQYRIAVDRAGYGESLPATPIPTIAAQARAIAPLLTPDCIIVGYSYGGPVALRLALDLPELVAGLLIISCPIDPQLEHVHPFQRIAATPLMSRFLPQGLHSSNIELLPLRSDLEALMPDLRRITAQITLMQGLNDTLVPASNATLLAAHLSSPVRSIVLPDGDHYLPWTHRTTIEQALDYTLRDCASVASRG